MKLRTKTYIYLGVVGVGVLANLALWRYRLHLYDLNTDYDYEPLHRIQMILFRGTQGFICIGLAFLAWSKFSGKR